MKIVIFSFAVMCMFLLTGCDLTTSSDLRNQLEASKAEASELAKKVAEERAIATAAETRASSAETAAGKASYALTIAVVLMGFLTVMFLLGSGLGFRAVRVAPVSPMITRIAKSAFQTKATVAEAKTDPKSTNGVQQ